jgi:hypothetical protein
LPNQGSPNQNPLGGPPHDPCVGFYEWLTPNSRMFVPPWYPSVAVQYEPTSKPPYQKLQYPTYVKDIDVDAHIRVFKKAIKVNGKTMEANITNLFGFILQNIISKWGENFVQDHPNYTFEELEQAFCKHF